MINCHPGEFPSGIPSIRKRREGPGGGKGRQMEQCPSRRLVIGGLQAWLLPPQVIHPPHTSNQIQNEKNNNTTTKSNQNQFKSKSNQNQIKSKTIASYLKNDKIHCFPTETNVVGNYSSAAIVSIFCRPAAPVCVCGWVGPPPPPPYRPDRAGFHLSLRVSAVKGHVGSINAPDVTANLQRQINQIIIPSR